MKRALLIVGLLAFVPSLMAADYAPVYQRVASSVVSVEVRRGAVTILGTGVFVDPYHVLTCAHVVRQETSVQIHTFPFGAVRYVRVLSVDSQHDLALLGLDTAVSETTVGHLSSHDAPTGAGVLIVGDGLGFDWSATSGIVSGRNRLDVHWSQTDATINPGNSGGPVFNRHGDIVGLANARLGPLYGAPGYGFFIPVSTIRAFLSLFSVALK